MIGDALLHMGLDGLDALRTDYGFAASDAASGMYPALYGRDSLWVLLLLLEAAAIHGDDRVDAVTAEAGLRILPALAQLQGATVDDAIDEQPGRIPHEHHPVPTAHAETTALPLRDGRSYGGFDETFLFVLACDAFSAAYADEPLTAGLRPNVERALAWIDGHADEDGDGLYEYTRRHQANLLNQVWKDSFDSATHNGFDVPPQPLAWLDVQAYAYAAFDRLAATGARRGDRAGADSHRRRAKALAAAVDERFWLGPAYGYAMTLDGDKRPVRMVSSNSGHALWAGLVPPDRVDPLVRRMLQPDLLSAYGLRTLSSASPFYAPFAYHRGAVWPFDNAVFTLGLWRVGRVAEALRVATAAATALQRLGTPVECYAVLEPQRFADGAVDEPALCWHRWPVRNRVQAFSAAALVVFWAVIEEAR